MLKHNLRDLAWLRPASAFGGGSGRRKPLGETEKQTTGHPRGWPFFCLECGDSSPLSLGRRQHQENAPDTKAAASRRTPKTRHHHRLVAAGRAGLRLASPKGCDVGKEAKRFLPTCTAARGDSARAAFFRPRHRLGRALFLQSRVGVAPPYSQISPMPSSAEQTILSSR